MNEWNPKPPHFWGSQPRSMRKIDFKIFPFFFNIVLVNRSDFKSINRTALATITENKTLRENPTWELFPTRLVETWLAQQNLFLSFLPCFLELLFLKTAPQQPVSKNWHVLQSQGPIMITVSRCGGGAQGNVMLGRRAEGKSRVAGSCPLCYVDVCGPWGHGTEGVSTPFNVQTHTPAHTHTHARAYQCWLQHRECLPTSPLGECEAWAAANRDNQCGLSCLSCSFMLSPSVRPPGRCSCLCEACALSDQGENFVLLSDGALLKGCFGVQSRISNVHAVCLWFSPKKPGGEACPLGCCHFTFSTAELFKDSNGQTTQSEGNKAAASSSSSWTSKTDLFVPFFGEGRFFVSLERMALNIHCGQDK